MAHIEKVNDGKYKAVVEIGVQGKRKRRTRTLDTYKEAENWMANMIRDKEEGQITDPNNITVSEYFERYLRIHKKPTVATTTYDNYKRRYEAHIKPDIGHIKLKDLHPVHLEEYFQIKRSRGKINGSGGLSENTLKKIYVLMNQCFKKAVKFNLIRHNPLDPIESPSPKKKEVSVMKEKEIAEIIKTAKENDFFMFVFISTMLYTGLRKSEALALSWNVIDLDSGILEVKRRLVGKKGVGAVIEEETKNNSSRRKIKLSERLVGLLKKYKTWQLEFRILLGSDYKGDDLDLVFCKPDGERYYPTSLNKKMKKITEKANLPHKSKIHIMRHTFATINVNNKVGPEIVQKMLGHSTISTTMDIYYHHDTDQQKEAVKHLDNALKI